MFLKKWTMLILAGALYWNPAEAGFRCEHLLKRGQVFLDELVASNGLRLFLKPVNQPNSERGFLKPADKNPNLLKWLMLEAPVRLGGVPDRQLAPLKGLYHHLIRRPTIYASYQIGLPKSEPSFLSLILLSWVAWNGVDAISEQVYNNKVEQIIQENALVYDDFIRYDFRFHQIKQELASGLLSKNAALTEAYWLKQALDRYYQLRAEEQSIPETFQLEQKYLDFFIDLKKVVANGIVESPGFTIPASRMGSLTSNQIWQLIDLSHSLYLKYQIIVEVVQSSALAESLSNYSSLAGEINNLKKDPFFEQVMEMAARGSISVKEAQSALQEDAFMQNRFAEWQILGVKKLKKTEAGDLTNEPLTLDDVRKEILADLAR
jgi:hypothetical protein